MIRHIGSFTAKFASRKAIKQRWLPCRAASSTVVLICAGPSSSAPFSPVMTADTP